MSTNLTTTSTTQPAADTPAQGAALSDSSIQQMANTLESLLSHTHVFYDDYGTACNCNCNCNCNCTRGSL